MAMIEFTSSNRYRRLWTPSRTVVNVLATSSPTDSSGFRSGQRALATGTVSLSLYQWSRASCAVARFRKSRTIMKSIKLFKNSRSRNFYLPVRDHLAQHKFITYLPELFEKDVPERKDIQLVVIKWDVHGSEFRWIVITPS